MLNNGSHPSPHKPSEAVPEPASQTPVPEVEEKKAEAQQAAEAPAPLLATEEEKTDELDSSTAPAPNDSIMAVYGGKDETFAMDDDSVLERTADTSTVSETPNPTAAEPKVLANGGETKEEEAPPEKEAVPADEAKMEVSTTEEAPSTTEEAAKEDKSDTKSDRGSKRHRDRSVTLHFSNLLDDVIETKLLALSQSRSSSPSNVNSAKSDEGPPPEDEPEWDNNQVLLDWYNSDLNLVISKTDFTSASPLTDGGFAYMWAGVRATYGFLPGKVCYEVKVSDSFLSFFSSETALNFLICLGD